MSVAHYCSLICNGNRGAAPLIGLDTKVLVHYLTQDDPEQLPHATVLVESFDEDTPPLATRRRR